VEAASLLHDVDKLARVKPETAGKPHADGSADWLARRGYAELGPAIVGHPVTRLADGAWFDRWIETASPEALIVAYADKRAGQRLESMDERFASWERRFPLAQRAERARGTWTAETLAEVRQRAAVIENRTCALAGVRPGEVGRLAWTNAAFAAVRSAGSAGVTASLPTARAAATVPHPGPR
jgi:hypothetical protein